MTVKKTTQVGEEVIRTRAKVVKNAKDREINKVVKNLIDSMRAADLVGMAAPQIGESVRIFVTEVRKTKFRKSEDLDKLRVFVNPKITLSAKKTVNDWEGCGSVADAGLFAKVRRPETVTVEALNENGEKFTLEAKGLLARVVQHEVDHLNGELFIDKADIRTCISRSEYLKIKSK